MSHSAQEKFDNLYITGYEIQQELGVDRSSVLRARERGILPQPITVRGVRAYIWEREVVKPFMDAWRISLQSRRGELKGDVK